MAVACTNSQKSAPYYIYCVKSPYRGTFEPNIERLLSRRFAVSMAATVDAALRCRVADAAELSAPMLCASCAASLRCPACDFVRAFHGLCCVRRACWQWVARLRIWVCVCAVRVRVNLRSQCSWASLRASREGVPPSVSLAFSPSFAAASAMLVYGCSPCRRSLPLFRRSASAALPAPPRPRAL